MIVDTIRGMVERGTAPITVLSLACGPAAEVFDALADPELASKVRFHLVDIDPRALRFVETKATELGLLGKVQFYGQDINQMVVKGPSQSGLPPLDLVYSLGLIDYFEERHVLKMVDFAFHALTDKGRLILGNFHPGNPMKLFMDWALEWRLIHRDEDRLNAICQRSLFQRPFDTIECEAEGVQAFATVTKRRPPGQRRRLEAGS